jgi:hypothetical protein
VTLDQYEAELRRIGFMRIYWASGWLRWWDHDDHPAGGMLIYEHAKLASHVQRGYLDRLADKASHRWV